MKLYRVALCLQVMLPDARAIRCEQSLRDAALEVVKPVAPYFVEAPTKQDLEELVEFYRVVSFEFFKPLFQKAYSAYDFGKNPDVYLNQDLVHDRARFIHALDGKDTVRLYVARTHDHKTILGLIMVSALKAETAEVDLLIVAKEARGSGVGRALIAAARKNFKGLKKMVVTPFSQGNEATLKFYERAGFVCKGPYSKEGLNTFGAPYKEVYLYYEMNLEHEKNNAAIA